MVRRYLIIGALIITTFISSGCETLRNREPRVQTVEVKIPVFQCPTNHNKIKKPTRPKLAIEKLEDIDIDDPGKVAKAYKITIKQLQGYSQELENGFDAYKSLCEDFSNENVEEGQ